MKILKKGVKYGLKEVILFQQKINRQNQEKEFFS